MHLCLIDNVIHHRKHVIKLEKTFGEKKNTSVRLASKRLVRNNYRLSAQTMHDIFKY